MQEIMPNKLATLIHDRLIRLDFEKADLDHDDPAVGLTLYLKDEIPETVFLNIRFEMVIQVAEPGARQPDGTAVDHLETIAFTVTDVLAAMGSQPHYVLELQPAMKKRLFDPCHKTAFRAVVDEARMHRRDWREEIVRVRFCHARHPDLRHEHENPRAKPLQARTGLPPREVPGDDAQDFQNLLATADDAFSDPSPDASASFPSDAYPDFNLDEALRTSAA